MNLIKDIIYKHKNIFVQKKINLKLGFKKLILIDLLKK